MTWGYYERIDAEDWQRCESFEFENRQRRFIKDSPSFNFYGRHEQYYSVFADIDLVEYVTTFPLNELMQKRFYREFFKHYFPDLAKIRAGIHLVTFLFSSNYSKLLTSILVSMILVCFAGLQVFAATYYVSPDGNNANSGTEALPFQTIQAGANAVSAGDISDGVASNFPGTLVKDNITTERYLFSEDSGDNIVNNVTSIGNILDAPDSMFKDTPPSPKPAPPSGFRLIQGQ